MRQPTVPDLIGCSQAHRQSPPPRPLPKRTRIQDPLLRRHYPASMLVWPCPTPGPADARGTVASVSPHRTGSPPMTRITLPTCRAHYPGGTEQVQQSIASPSRAAFAGLPAGRLPRHTFSRPARASLALRPARSLNRPRRPLSRGSDTAGYPAAPLASYQSKSTTLWVEPSSTGVPRRRGAR